MEKLLDDQRNKFQEFLQEQVKNSFKVYKLFQGCALEVPGWHMQVTFAFRDWKSWITFFIYIVSLIAGHPGFHH